MTNKITLLFGLACLLGTPGCWDPTGSVAPSQPGSEPDLTIEHFAVDRAPKPGEPFNVTVGVGNMGQGTAQAGAVVQWFARQGDLFPSCEWTLPAIGVREQIRMHCEYAGYSSASANVNMKTEVDVYDFVDEGDPAREANNVFIYRVPVR